MPRSGYRKRAVNRLKGAGNRKANCPTARFTLNKSYWVASDAGKAAPQDGSVLQINASSPFQPITVVNGLWAANDTNNEPFGLSSGIYAQYRHVSVRGCHVKVNVMDSPDNAGSGTNTLLEGTASLIRTSDTGVILAATENKEIRNMYGSKMRDFQCGDLGNLKKSCTLSSGYSPMKTWHQSALTNEELKIVNTSGSANVPTDNTYIMLMIRPSDDTVANLNIKPIKVQLRITYILTFTEPTASTNIPMPQQSSYFSYPKLSYPKLGFMAKGAQYSLTALGALAAHNIAARRTGYPYRVGFRGIVPRYYRR